MGSKFPLTYDTWDNHEKNIIKKFSNAKRFTYGPITKKYEKNLSKFFKSKYCVSVNSGSSANLLALNSLFYKKERPLKRGDEVIVTSLGWSTTYSPLQQMGLKIRVIDIDLSTLSIDIDSLKANITNKTRLILVVNPLGNANHFDEIQDICRKKNIYLFEDNAEGMGAKYKGKYTGTFGIVGTFSTFFSHHISTIEGGFVLTDDKEIYEIMLSIRSHGWTRDLENKNSLIKKSKEYFDETWRFIFPGYNLRPNEIYSSLGISQLKKLNKFILARRKNNNFLKKLFLNSPFIIQEEIGQSSSFGFSFIVKKEAGLSRKDVVNVLKKNKIDYRPIIIGNFLRSESIKYYDILNKKELLINCDYVHKNGFMIGNSHIDLKKQISYLHNSLSVFF